MPGAARKRRPATQLREAACETDEVTASDDDGKLCQIASVLTLLAASRFFRIDGASLVSADDALAPTTVKA